MTRSKASGSVWLLSTGLPTCSGTPWIFARRSGAARASRSRSHLASPSEIEPATVSRGATPDHLGDGRLIVLIDDDPSVREGTSGLLHGWGFEVVETPSAEEAFAILRKEAMTPSLVIADYGLGGGRNGIEGISSVRHACERSLPAFLISGVANPEHLEIARNAGLEVLRRPLAPADLRASVMRHLQA